MLHYSLQWLAGRHAYVAIFGIEELSADLLSVLYMEVYCCPFIVTPLMSSIQGGY